MSKESKLAVNPHGLGVNSHVIYTPADGDGKRGVIKFIGKAPFSEKFKGDWIGICLETPDGKNNGTVGGHEYFKAGENHGLFVNNWDKLRPDTAVGVGDGGSDTATSKPTSIKQDGDVKPTVRPAVGVSRLSTTTKAETDSKPSNATAISSAREKMQALQEKRKNLTASVLSKPSTVLSSSSKQGSSFVSKGDGSVPSTPARKPPSTPVEGETPAPRSGSLLRSGSSSAEDFKDLKSPGKDAALIEMLQSSIYKLTRESDEQTSTISDQKNSIFELTAMGDGYRAQVEELTTAASEAAVRQTELETQIAALEEANEALRAQVTEESRERESAAQRESVLTETISKLKAQLESSSQQYQQLLESSAGGDSVSAGLQRTVDELQLKVAQGEENTQAADVKFSVLQSQHEAALQLQAQMETDVAALRESLVAAEKRSTVDMAEVVSTADALRSRVAVLEQELQTAHAKEAELTGAADRLQSTVETLRANLAAATESDGLAGQLQQTVAELEAREGALRKELSVELNKVTQQNERLKDSETTVAQLRGAISALEAKEQALLGELEAARSTESLQVEQLRANESSLAQLQQALDILQSRESALNEELKAQRAREAQQQERLGDTDSSLAELQQELNDTRTARDELLEEKQASDSLCEELQQTVLELEASESALQKELQQLKNTVSAQVQQLAQQELSLADLTARDQDSTELIGQLRLRLAEAEKRLTEVPPPPVVAALDQEGLVAELQSQIEDLNDSLERLAMDKEQLMLDAELLQEKIASLEAAAEEAQQTPQLSLPSAPHSSEALDFQSSAHLIEEIERLRESLQALEDMSAEEKDLIATQTEMLEELEAECAELRVYKDHAEESMAEMRQSVDSMSAYESMIESLTEKNLELVSEMNSLQQTVSDLEESVELNEELDARQTQQIEEDRRVIDSLHVAAASNERALAEKDSVIAEQSRQMDRLKHSHKTLQLEVQALRDTLASESLESKSVETKLRDVSALRSQQEMLAQEVNTLHQQLTAANAQKYRFQALFSRMDALFGSSSFYLEESKLVSTEVVFVSTATMGFDALKQLSALIGEVTSNRLSCEYQDQCSRNMGSLMSMYLLLLRGQCVAVQSTVSLFRDAEGANHTPQLQAKVLLLTTLKSIFERVLQLCFRLAELDKLSTRREKLKFDAEQQDGEAVEASERAGLFGSNQVAFEEVMQGFSATLTELRDLANGSIDEPANNFRSPDEEVPLASVELVLLSLNSLCDFSMFELQQRQSDGGEVPVVSGTLDLLKSLKIELKSCAFSLKGSASHFVAHLSTLQSVLTAVSALFSEEGGLLTLSTEDCTAALKTALTNIRSVNSAPAALHTALGSVVTIGVSGVLKYFPLVLMTRISSASSTSSLQQEDAQLRDQFSEHIKKYWGLLIQSSSDLIVGVDGNANGDSAASSPMKTTPNKGGLLSANFGNAAEVSWKARVSELRKVVTNRLALGSGTPSAASSTKHSASSGAAFFPSEATMGGLVSAEQHNAVLRELDVKRDELRSAMTRCLELQKLHEANLAASNASNQSSNSEEVAKLQREISVLTVALEATEQRVEVLDKEAKALKTQQQPTAVSPVPKEKGLTRRHSQLDIKESAKSGQTAPAAPLTFASLLAGTQVVPTATRAAQQSSVDSQQVAFLSAQVSHWKRVAMKRLAQSLVQIPEYDAFASSDSRSVPAVSQEVDYPPGNVVQQPNVFSKHIELEGYGPNTTVAEYKALYRKIRLLRASSIRIKSIAGSGPTQLPGAEESKASSSEALRNRVRSRPTLIYRIKPHSEGPPQ